LPDDLILRGVCWNSSLPSTFVILRRQWATAVTSRADEYRANARECEQLAEQTRDPYIKEQFLKIAQQWRDMADHLEKYSR
jgi:hypothetical protein